MSGVVSSPLHQRPKMMRRIAVKLLQQSMLVSAEDDLGEHVLQKYIANYIGAYKVSIIGQIIACMMIIRAVLI
jgi:hypothetical protein